MSLSLLSHAGAAFRKRKPLQVTCFLTRRCNASCPYCFYTARKNHTSAPESREPGLDELERFSAGLGKLLWLAFSGGEIFLRRDLVEITSMLYIQNRPSIILLPTNGLDTREVVRKTQNILRRCPGSTVVVKISLDGPRQVHDSLRKTSGGYDRAWRTLQELGRLLPVHPNLELGINSVFCPDNQDHLPAFLSQMQSRPEIKTHTVSLLRKGTLAMPPDQADLEKYAGLIKHMEKDLFQGQARSYRFFGAGLKTAQDILQRRLIYQTAREKKQLIPCYAGRLNLVLSSNGDVLPCEYFIPEMVMGNIYKDGTEVQKILDSPRAARILAGIRAGKCHCAHECYMMTNILFNPRLYPRLLRIYLGLLRRAHV